MRYGLRVMPPAGVPQTAANMMAYTREAGFGDEVKRRIVLGTYALSAGYYDAWYGSAQKVRTLIIDDFKKAFEKVDVLVGPTSPVTAFKFGEKTEDPMAMYAIDITTIPANLAGVPAMSIPAGLSDDGLPVGFQFLARSSATRSCTSPPPLSKRPSRKLERPDLAVPEDPVARRTGQVGSIGGKKTKWLKS